jgi:signal transduction histidine kinase
MLVILSFTMFITFCASYEIAKHQVLDVGGEMFESVLKDSIGFIDAMNQRVEAGDLQLKEAQGGREEVIYKHRLVAMKWAFVHVATYTFTLAFLLIYLFSRRFSHKINKINAAMSEVGKGNLQQNIHFKLKDEFGRLADNFNLMVHNLQDYVRDKSGEDPATRDPVHDESRQYLQTLSESESRLIKLVTSRVLKAQEEERKRIARELHDGIGQVLYSVVIATKLLKKQVDVGGPHTDYVHDVEAAIAQTMTELKSIIHELRPAVLEEMGLVPAIQTYIPKFESKYQITVNLHLRTEHKRFSPEVETAVYRVLQEALVNAGKYAECDRIDITLLESGSTLELTVRDFGTGFTLTDDPLPSNGFGLYGMKERIHLLEGTIRIDSAPGRGTSIYVSIPLTP